VPHVTPIARFGLIATDRNNLRGGDGAGRKGGAKRRSPHAVPFISRLFRLNAALYHRPPPLP
jgi:hypothetical protein